jgi:hypothetical protein
MEPVVDRRDDVLAFRDFLGADEAAIEPADHRRDDHAQGDDGSHRRRAAMEPADVGRMTCDAVGAFGDEAVAAMEPASDRRDDRVRTRDDAVALGAAMEPLAGSGVTTTSLSRPISPIMPQRSPPKVGERPLGLARKPCVVVPLWSPPVIGGTTARYFRAI